jgi:hypothetical protein
MGYYPNKDSIYTRDGKPKAAGLMKDLILVDIYTVDYILMRSY